MAREKETQRLLIRKEAQITAEVDAKEKDLNWDNGSLYFLASYYLSYLTTYLYSKHIVYILYLSYIVYIIVGCTVITWLNIFSCS